jgi:hypothetical protein
VDRRGFLKSLAALGVAVPTAALAGRPTRAVLDGALAGLAGTPWWVPVLRAWKDGPSSPALASLCDALEVPLHTECDRADAAVARLLLGGIQHTLPAWTAMLDEGVVTARPVFPVRLDGAPVFEPAHVATVNWADSGPGFAWPEAYHVTTVPELRMHVVTASRDSDDLMGCTDHALGWRSIRVPPHESARALLRATWRRQRRGHEQAAWEDVLAEGLLDAATLVAARDAVWPRRDTDDGDDAWEADRG